MGQAIFFSGPIGTGKTTLGRAVAGRLDARFFDGDDFAVHDRPWYASSLSTSAGIADAVRVALSNHRLAVVAYPLRRTNYVYFCRRLGAAGHQMTVVTLRASMVRIVDPTRGRTFSPTEVTRIGEMIAEGYDARPFSDLVCHTDASSFGQTVETLLSRLQPLLM